MAAQSICTIPNCSKPVVARGWCDTHYCRWKRTGDPQGSKARELGPARLYLEEIVLPYEGDDCLIWPFGRSVYGYGRIKYLGKDYAVSRLACIEVNGPPPTPKHEAAHNCGNGHLGCVNPKHLRWATREENRADRLIHGTHDLGEQNGASKLKTAEVIKIRALEGVMSQRKIAGMFNISSTTVSRIHHRHLWGWL